MQYHNLDDLVANTGYYRKFIAHRMGVPNYTLSKAIHEPDVHGKHVPTLKAVLVDVLCVVDAEDFDMAEQRTRWLNEEKREAAKLDLLKQLEQDERARKRRLKRAKSKRRK